MTNLLAFVHPAWMVFSLVTALATARRGLEIRRRRVHRQPVGASLRRRHLRLGKTAIGMVVVGFLAGPVSMLLFRDRSAFDSFHGVLGIVVLGLFLWTGWTGRRLHQGDSDLRGLHRGVAASALAAALLSAVAGFILLP